jgi:hypothetical protein
MALGYKVEDEGRMMSSEEAHQQISHGASLFRAVLRQVEGRGRIIWIERLTLAAPLYPLGLSWASPIASIETA